MAETLDQLHEQRKELDILLEEVEAKADRAEQWFEDEIDNLIHSFQSSRPKAIAKIKDENRAGYEKMMDLKRENKQLIRQARRAERDYYNERYHDEKRRGLDSNAKEF